MPQKTKRKSRAATAAKRRWTSEIFEHSDNDTNDGDFMNLSNLSANEEEEFLSKDKINISDIGDLFEIRKNQISARSLSVLIYLSLTYFGSGQ